MPNLLVFTLVAMGYCVRAANSTLFALLASLLAAFVGSMISTIVQGWTNVQLMNSSLNIAINKLRGVADTAEVSGSNHDGT